MSSRCGKTNMAPGAPQKSVTADSLKKKRVRSVEGQRAKRESDKRRSKTRITIGAAITKWRQVKKQCGIKTDSKMAFILLDSYLRTKAENRPERPALDRSSSTETCESVHYEYPFMMSSPNEAEREASAAASVQSSENGKESGKKDAACQRWKSQDEWVTTNQSENKENRDSQEDKDEEFSTSLSVGDGHYLVDLGSSSEFIVDEECILQLFRSCRECNRQCTVRKHVKGLKLVVYQACCFCQSRCKWTNLPGDDDGDFQINGKEAAHEQTNSAMSPSRITS
ncbi:uncharacterized protein LOC121604356 isoform X1 [Chelmon rostratus]|uniref:uncharacterized protein LOC121604356 isoform X1 n=1 Tax=Chelmon rostratus TaxID=109905 RepID=UPI001BE5ED75|nr:uncharacterized protein LOC121604356 isoform X1 [Chelmon rostratus]